MAQFNYYFQNVVLESLPSLIKSKINHYLICIYSFYRCYREKTEMKASDLQQLSFTVYTILQIQ